MQNDGCDIVILCADEITTSSEEAGTPAGDQIAGLLQLPEAVVVFVTANTELLNAKKQINKKTENCILIRDMLIPHLSYSDTINSFFSEILLQIRNIKIYRSLLCI